MPILGQLDIRIGIPSGPAGPAVLASFFNVYDYPPNRYVYVLHAEIASYHKVTVTGTVGDLEIVARTESGAPWTVYRAAAAAGIYEFARD